MKKNVLLFLFVIAWNLLIAQNVQIDSLKKVLPAQKEDTNKANTLNSLAYNFIGTNNDSTVYFSNEALKLARKINYEMGIADAYLYLGGVLINSAKFEEGLENNNRALKIYQQLLATGRARDKIRCMNHEASVYTNFTTYYSSKGNYPEALKYVFLALKLYETTGEETGAAVSYQSIASTYFSEGDLAGALKYFLIALRISQKHSDKFRIAQDYMCMGLVEIEKGNQQAALNNYLFAQKIYEELGPKAPNWGLPWVYGNIGNIYELQGDKAASGGNKKAAEEKYLDALKYYFKSFIIYDDIGRKDALAEGCSNLGVINVKLQKLKNAADYLKKGLQLSKELNDKEDLRSVYQGLTALDSARNDYRHWLEHYKLYILYRDSLHNQESIKKTTQISMQYEFDKKESLAKAEQVNKDAVADKELQKQKLVRNGFEGGFAVVLLFAGVFFTQRNKITRGKKRSDELLLNILPSEVAEELKEKGSAEAKQFEEVTVMFTDFKNFTRISEKLSPSELVTEIHTCFKAFDNIITKHNIEKIKTIGDSYMCAGGLPVANKTNATDVVSAALEIQQFMREHLQQRRNEGKEPFEIRIGVHTGAVVAGIVGVKKFAYDIWGDTVNIASRMESSGEAGKVNISGSTYELVKDKFLCTHRGMIQAKNKGEIDMYFVETVS